ncbi:MAG: methyl-accepting chemotaxis protein [Treponema sp.]|jgi:methyl-accepting chemotaxis protein|nr:methyl-accepting chemotaxis protein [Treponema sp.]
MKISAKLMIIILALAFTGILTLIAVTVSFSKIEIEELSYTNARNLAQEHGRDVQNWIELYMNASRTIAQIMEQFEELDPAVRRSTFDIMLRGVVEANDEILGVWSIWEPNALDGMDDVYVDTIGTDSSGRYIPWWVKSNGNIIVQACVEYEDADYYQYPLSTGNEMVTDPTYWDIDGKPTLMADLVIPIKNRGKVVGTVGIDIAISIIQSKISAIKPYEGSIAAVFSNEGTVVAHFDPNRIAQPMRETEEAEAGSHLNDYVQAVLKGEVYFFRNKNAVSNVDMFFTSVPFTIGKITNPWSLVIGVPIEVVMEPVYNILTVCSIIGLGIVIAVEFAAFFISRSVSRPINSFAFILKDISEGEGDLTKTITITTQDEIRDLAHYFNLTISKIKDLVSAIKQEAIALSQTGTNLASNMAETSHSINKITANIQSIKTQTNKQQTSVKVTSSAMEQVVENIETLNSQIEKQAECVRQSSSAIEEMLANIQSVTQSLVQNEDNITKLDHAAEVGQTGLQEVSADIYEIAAESAGLLEINTVMQSIASQTNLLSMNAAIEAAHAGEAGKGFAVVADEIRKLAESSGEQSKTISKVLKKIKGSIDKITKSTEAVLLRFEAISDGVRKVTEQETNVRTAMEEQGVGSKNILEAISGLYEITGNVTQGAHMIEGRSREAIKESQTLKRITEEISGDMKEIAAGAEQIDGAVNEVNDISGENKKQIEALMEEVSRFKVA